MSQIKECNHVCPECGEFWDHWVNWDCSLTWECVCDDCQAKREAVEIDAETQRYADWEARRYGR